MLDALPAIVAYVDRDLRYQYANAPHLAWTGQPAEAYLGRSLWELMPPALRASVEPHILRALAGERVEVEFALPPGFGRTFVRLMAMPDRDETGEVIGLVFMTTDLTQRHLLEEQLKRSEATFHNAFHASAIGKALVDLEGRCTQINTAFAAMLGYARDEFEGMTFAEVTHPDDLDADLAQFEAVKRGEIDAYDMEKRYLHRDGGVVHALLSVAVVRDDDRAPLFFVSQMIDINARKAAERELHASNARLRLAMEVLEGGVWQYDIAAATIDVSGGLARVFGFASEGPRPIGDIARVVRPEDLPVASLAALIAGDEDRGTVRYRITAADGSTRWIRDRRQLVRDEAGRPVQILGVTVDVTAERANETRLEREAATDALTGLLNRRGFDAAVAQVLARPEAADGHVALLLLDLDGFKPINDSFGHAAGDRVLREVARRIAGQVRSGDIVARLGGDEFAVLLPCVDRTMAERAANRIVAALAVPHVAGGMSVTATVSVGVALAGEHDATAATLFERADGALYGVKRGGRGRWAMAA